MRATTESIISYIKFLEDGNALLLATIHDIVKDTTKKECDNFDDGKCGHDQCFAIAWAKEQADDAITQYMEMEFEYIDNEVKRSRAIEKETGAVSNSKDTKATCHP